jgi:hypothetical protein
MSEAAKRAQRYLEKVHELVDGLGELGDDPNEETSAEYELLRTMAVLLAHNLKVQGATLMVSGLCQSLPSFFLLAFTRRRILCQPRRCQWARPRA